MRIPWLLMTVLSAFVESPAHPAPPRTFTIYAFIPWPQRIEGGTPARSMMLGEYLGTLGVRGIRVIYDFNTEGKPDPVKIHAIADAALGSPDVPVSFDTEFGDRFTPETVLPGVMEILRLYRERNPGAPVGVYAVLPQNSYGGKADTRPFAQLDARYAAIVPLVDFLSPVFYNYDGHDLVLWKRAAEWGMAEARKYGKGKRILPYISPVVVIGKAAGVTAGTTVEPLTESEMNARLQSLYDLGADGCIIWASSQARMPDGTTPRFNRDNGWGKAVADFAVSHP